MPTPFVIGIDLGTTNSSLSYAGSGAAGEGPLEAPPVHPFAIAQLANPGETRDEPLLPSFLYLAGPNDFPPGSLALPWNAEAPLTGMLARRRGAEVPARLIASAKSWLSHAAVDRTSALLPLNAPEGVARISPVDASRFYLEHLRHAWNAAHPGTLLENQQVLVTVPASFDAVARDLTLHAATEAGYRDVVLLEEPQAAFYAWIERHPDWRERIQVGDLILVADIGGGTTDFTLITVTEEAGELRLERVAVGEHILLGGDNMDLALARHIEQQLAAKSAKLDALQLYALWQQCREAKEALLDPEHRKNDHPVTILGRGSSLVGGAIKTKLARADVERILLDGFFPAVASTETTQRARARAGLAELGLPYAADAAITRHLARFLRQSSAGPAGDAVRRSPSGLACPTHVLFNGGVLRAGLARERLMEVLNAWLAAEGAPAAQPLPGEDLMQAVSRGAAYYGLSRLGRGVRIRGGVPRTYYVGIESSMPAVPGMPAPLKALTVVPFGMEEGTELRFPDRQFGLAVGEPAEFRFFQSATRRNDAAGSLIDEVSDDIEEIAPMEVQLPAEGAAGSFIPVTLESVVTPTGLLQLWCVARDGRRWKLEFNVRERHVA